MCGRFNFTDEDLEDIKRIILEVSRRVGQNVTTGEVRPTNRAAVLLPDGASAMGWGFPKWQGTGVIINARAETAHEKTLFREPLKSKRCIVPSTGYFEWRHEGGKVREKYLLRRPNEKILYMAGLYDEFRYPDGSVQPSFVVLTTQASRTVSEIHDRMPVILAPEEQVLWLRDEGFANAALTRAGPELILEECV